MTTMRLSLLFLLTPLVLCVKELPGEELPSKENLLQETTLEDEQPYLAETEDGQNQVVKRSISEIAARRRSALDKSFMRFGRSDPDMTSGARVKMANGNLMRFGRSNKSGFLRLGRARSSDFMRFGRSPGNLMRFGRANNNLMRFGRAHNNLMRFGRGGNNNLMRFGRGGNNNLMRFGRANNNLMRFGRAGNNLMRFGRANHNLMRFGRANNNLMRFGRSDDDFLNYENEPSFEDFSEEEQNPTVSSDPFVRLERSVQDLPEQKTANYADRKNDNFMRLGRSLLEKTYDDGDSNENDDNSDVMTEKVANDKLNMYLDDNFMRLGQDEPTENRDADAFDALFPEDARKKRSLVKVPKTEPEVETGNKSDVSSVRHAHSEAGTRCAS